LIEEDCRKRELVIGIEQANRHDEGKYRDICCGELYRQHEGYDDTYMKHLSCFILMGTNREIQDPQYIKILNISRSPIQRILVELPASIRYSLKDELFCVLFQSQKHFVDQVKAINR
jgi:hypothetical protein